MQIPTLILILIIFTLILEITGFFSIFVILYNFKKKIDKNSKMSIKNMVGIFKNKSKISEHVAREKKK